MHLSQILHRNIDSVDRRSNFFSSGGGSSSSNSNNNNNNANSSNSGSGGGGCSSNDDSASAASSSVASSSSSSCTTLHIRCKDLRVVSVEFNRSEEMTDVADSLEKLAAMDDVARSKGGQNVDAQ